MLTGPRIAIATTVAGVAICAAVASQVAPSDRTGARLPLPALTAAPLVDAVETSDTDPIAPEEAEVADPAAPETPEGGEQTEAVAPVAPAPAAEVDSSPGTGKPDDPGKSGERRPEHAGP